jgi:hypothetical protein
LRQKHRLKVSENRVLRKICGPKRDENESWRKLHNDELHSPYSSPNTVRVIKSRMREDRGAYRLLVGKYEGKRPLGRPGRRREDNIKMDLREIEIDRANWIRLVQEWVQWRAFVSTVMHLRAP